MDFGVCVLKEGPVRLRLTKKGAAQAWGQGPHRPWCFGWGRGLAGASAGKVANEKASEMKRFSDPFLGH